MSASAGASAIPQGRAQQANLIVLGAHGASHFAPITRTGSVRIAR
jgi:nucleotide-binding universal stress UspA family protein